MTQKVSDEQYGRVSKRAHELVRRISQGTLPFDLTLDLLQQIIEGKKTPKYPVKYYYPIPVDPMMPLTDLLRSAGYDEKMVAGIFTDENFPPQKAWVKEVKFAVVELPNGCLDDGLAGITRLAEMDLRPANLRETIAFQAKFPEAQRGRELNVINVYEKKHPSKPLLTSHYNACFWEIDQRRGLRLGDINSRNIHEYTWLVAAVCE